MKEIDIWLKIFSDSDKWDIIYQDNHIKLIYKNYIITQVHIDLDSSKNIIGANYIFGGPQSLVGNSQPKIITFDKSTLIEWFGQDKWNQSELFLKRSYKLDQLL